MSIIYLSLDEQINNFGGSATKIGSPVSNLQNRLDLVNIKDSISYDHPHSSTPIENSNTAKIFTDSIFKFDNDRPIIKGFTRLLNDGIIAYDINSSGTKNTNITSGIHARSTNKNRLDTTAIRNNKFNLYTGKFEFATGSPGVYNDNFGTDMAAAVSRDNPGTFAFKYSQVINRKSYSPKT